MHQSVKIGNAYLTHRIYIKYRGELLHIMKVTICLNKLCLSKWKILLKLCCLQITVNVLFYHWNIRTEDNVSKQLVQAFHELSSVLHSAYLYIILSIDLELKTRDNGSTC